MLISSRAWASGYLTDLQCRNLIRNGSTERRDEGISDFGVSIIERMNKVGMAVDVSHCGDRTTLDAFEISKKPVLITHSNCRALVPDTLV
jgi:membrane dipeptidase